MKKIVVTCLLISASFLAFAQQTAPPTNPTETTQAFFKALLDENGTAMRSLLTTDFAIISFDGSLVDGSTLSDAVSGGYVVIETGTLTNLSTRTYGDAGVVTGTWQAKGGIQGNAFESKVAFSAMCVKQGGGWKVASVQMTPTM